MAELAIRLRVFVASPADVRSEREIAEKAVLEQARKVGQHGLFLDPFLWEKQGRPGLGRPQDLLNPELDSTELTVVIFWSRLGSPASSDGRQSGTEEELSLSEALVRRGRSDDVFVYFRTADPPQEAPVVETARVHALREQMAAEKSVFFWEYQSPLEFGRAFEDHLQSWLGRWQKIPDICRFTLRNSSPGRIAAAEVGENKIDRLRAYFNLEQEVGLTSALGGIAVAAYQEFGPAGSEARIDSSRLRSIGPRWENYLAGKGPLRPVSVSPFGSPQARRSLETPLVGVPDGGVYFSSEDWFHYFCAAGLVEAIENDRSGATENWPYINPVHEYLAAMLNTIYRPRRAAIISQLTDWLATEAGKPIVRNFAAYVLGTVGAQEAQDALAYAARMDRGKDVRVYSVTSLGKLRSRRHLNLLVTLFSEESDEQTKLTIGQAICRIIGIAEFPL